MQGPIVETRSVRLENGKDIEYRVCFDREYTDYFEVEIIQFKYGGRQALGHILGEYLCYALREIYDRSDYDYLLPIPSKPSSIARFGYDQIRLIAEGLSELCGLPVATNILEALECPTQVGLSGDDRRENIKGKFRLIDPDAAAGKRFLVIDDTLTTGATLDEVIKTLSTATTEPLDALILARVPEDYYEHPIPIHYFRKSHYVLHDLRAARSERELREAQTAKKFTHKLRTDGTRITYRLKPITFYISTGIDGKRWKQEAKDAYQIISDALPEWFGLVIHRGLTPEKTPGDYWSIAETEAGSLVLGGALLPVYDKHALIGIAIDYVHHYAQKLTREEHQQNIKNFRESLKHLEDIGEKRLSSVEKKRKSRIVFSVN